MGNTDKWTGFGVIAVALAGIVLVVLKACGAVGVVTPFLVEYYGNGRALPVGHPIPTIPTHDKFGLVQGRILTLPDGTRYKLDITHRMLTVRELAAATGFPEGYVFVGKDGDAKRMIGNAVPPPLAEALYRSALTA